MEKSKNQKIHKVIIFLLFIVSSAFIVYFFPKEGKFRYEYQKGLPWLHEDLIAPFDFPIYKSEMEITAERDSILKNFRPYFNFDMELAQEQLDRFNLAYEEKWKRFITQITEDNESKLTRWEIEQIKKRKEEYASLITGLLIQTYEKGIVDASEILNQISNDDFSIVVVKNNIAEHVDVENIHTQKTAYKLVTEELNNFIASHKSRVQQAELSFFRQLSLNEFITSNLFYDEVTTNKVKENLLSDISLTYGKVGAKERIISEGELINNEKFAILESLKKEYETRLGGKENFYLILIGQILLSVIILLVLFLFLINFRREILQSKVKTLFILLLILIFTFIASFIKKYTSASLYMIPFAIVPIIIKTFYDSRLALFIHLIAILIVGFWAPNSFEFVFLNLIAGIIAIFSLTNLYRRGKLVLSALLVILAYSFVYLGIAILQEGNLAEIQINIFLWFGINGLLVLTAAPLIYFFEKIFGFISDATLMELSDTNQPLLRELAEKAPGTFQHSMQVANLAESAVLKIGGNPLLVRTGALYHDIGKLVTSHYFVENLAGDENPHEGMDYVESANIIIGHVNKGLEIARKHNLPQQIIEFINTHHGTSKAQYFYYSHLKEHPDKKIDEKKFMYPGPEPISKEASILMMADSVEASSRTLKKFSEETLREHVNKIIDNQLKEGQFNHADITFKEIALVKEIFIDKLKNIYHARIEYPNE